MDLKKVYVIVGKDLDVKNVKKDMKLEGYKFEFHFDREASMLTEANEVWLFGDVESEPDYLMAMLLGCDIWNM